MSLIIVSSKEKYHHNSTILPINAANSQGRYLSASRRAVTYGVIIMTININDKSTFYKIYGI